jgi:tetratricopeptide (TPR) repeat protein
MSDSRRGSGPRRFFERFRAEVARYADGVHRLGDPAPPAAVAGLPEELAAFLRSWNGADLFIDAVQLFAADAIEPAGPLLLFGRAGADALALDAAGQVLRVEDDTGESLTEGTGFGAWLEGFMAAEATLYDREGEFRDGLFDDGGEELLPAAAERRERRALKVDPEAPAPAWRLARALDRRGQPAKAVRVLEPLVARAPGFAWAWFDLGRLRRAAGDLAGAEAAFARAAAADPDYEHAGYFAAHAARAAHARGDDRARAAHAASALAHDADLAGAQRRAAEELCVEGRHAEALEAAEVAAGLAPRDVAVVDLVRRCRAVLTSARAEAKR